MGGSVTGLAVLLVKLNGLAAHVPGGRKEPFTAHSSAQSSAIATLPSGSEYLQVNQT